MAVYAKRAQADGQHTHGQTEQNGLSTSADRRSSRAVPLGPICTGRPKALREGTTQVFWCEIRLRDPERLTRALEGPGNSCDDYRL